MNICVFLVLLQRLTFGSFLLYLMQTDFMHSFYLLLNKLGPTDTTQLLTSSSILKPSTGWYYKQISSWKTSPFHYDFDDFITVSGDLCLNLFQKSIKITQPTTAWFPVSSYDKIMLYILVVSLTVFFWEVPRGPCHCFFLWEVPS